MDIRRASPRELDSYVQTLKAAGLGARTEVLRFAFSHQDIHAYVALHAGTVVGTGCATAYAGETGWLGYISVLPEFRGRGTGRALAVYGEEWLASRGVKSMILLATPEGRRLYEKMGYVAGIEYVAYEGVPAGGVWQPTCGEGRRHITVMGEAVGQGGEAAQDGEAGQDGDAGLSEVVTACDWGAILTLDRLATGETRERLLKAMTGVIVGRDSGGVVVGFFAHGPWGTGPIITSDPKVGCQLLELSWMHCTARPIRVHVPLANEAATEYVHRRGFSETSRSLYMVKGPWPEPYNPQMIYSMLGFSFG